MERIELVEALEKELETVNAEKAEYKAKADKAYKKSIYALKAKLDSVDDKNEPITVHFSATAMTYSNAPYIVEAKDYSINRVIELGYKIGKVREEIENYKATIADYELHSIVDFIKEIVED